MAAVFFKYLVVCFGSELVLLNNHTLPTSAVRIIFRAEPQRFVVLALLKIRKIGMKFNRADRRLRSFGFRRRRNSYP